MEEVASCTPLHQPAGSDGASRPRRVRRTGWRGRSPGRPRRDRSRRRPPPPVGVGGIEAAVGLPVTRSARADDQRGPPPTGTGAGRSSRCSRSPLRPPQWCSASRPSRTTTCPPRRRPGGHRAGDRRRERRPEHGGTDEAAPTPAVPRPHHGAGALDDTAPSPPGTPTTASVGRRPRPAGRRSRTTTRSCPDDRDAGWEPPHRALPAHHGAATAARTPPSGGPSTGCGCPTCGASVSARSRRPSRTTSRTAGSSSSDVLPPRRGGRRPQDRRVDGPSSGSSEARRRRRRASRAATRAPGPAANPRRCIGRFGRSPARLAHLSGCLACDGVP